MSTMQGGLSGEGQGKPRRWLKMAYLAANVLVRVLGAFAIGWGFILLFPRVSPSGGFGTAAILSFLLAPQLNRFVNNQSGTIAPQNCLGGFGGLAGFLLISGAIALVFRFSSASTPSLKAAAEAEFNLVIGVCVGVGLGMLLASVAVAFLCEKDSKEEFARSFKRVEVTATSSGEAAGQPAQHAVSLAPDNILLWLESSRSAKVEVAIQRLVRVKRQEVASLPPSWINISLTGGDPCVQQLLKAEAGRYRVTLLLDRMWIKTLIYEYVDEPRFPPDAQQSAGASPPTLSAFLQRAESLGQAGNLEEAAEALEQALVTNSLWAAEVAGYPCQTVMAQVLPVSGYGLLVHLAGEADNKVLAARYFKRMLELNPTHPGDARQAAREAKITKEAKKIAREMGVPFGFWEY